jgi:uncharacterized protein (AIM24 family)
MHSRAQPKVSVSDRISEKLGTGIFGGEGFIMEKLEGDGMALCMQADTCLKKLQVGELRK